MIEQPQCVTLTSITDNNATTEQKSSMGQIIVNSDFREVFIFVNAPTLSRVLYKL